MQSRRFSGDGKWPIAIHASTAGSQVIVNADDFGRSSEINQAVLRAHREGILTSEA